MKPTMFLLEVNFSWRKKGAMPHRLIFEPPSMDSGVMDLQCRNTHELEGTYTLKNNTVAFMNML